MIIDSHAHVMLPTEKQILMMEEAGVDKTILFSTTPHPEKAHDLKSLEKELDILNNILASNTSLSLTYDETAHWIIDNVIKNKFYGLGEFSPASGQVKYLEVVFQASNELGYLPIWVHTFHPLNFEDIKELIQLAKKYPQIPLILGHMGGIHWLDTIKLAKESDNIYLDLSATYTVIAPKIVIKELPERTLFSSDAPYGNPLLLRRMIEISSPDKKVLEQVLGGNVLELLKL